MSARKYFIAQYDVFFHFEIKTLSLKEIVPLDQKEKVISEFRSKQLLGQNF